MRAYQLRSAEVAMLRRGLLLLAKEYDALALDATKKTKLGSVLNKKVIDQCRTDAEQSKMYAQHANDLADKLLHEGKEINQGE